MSFKTTLFKAVLSADVLRVHGQIHLSCQKGEHNKELSIHFDHCKFNCPGFIDQEIDIDVNGLAAAKGLDAETYTFIFLKHRPIMAIEILDGSF